ncbi:MAG: hypothetical protein Q9P44_15780 [Anaerolineae bacterium]|nr:hypothetical protein [Anaerolineae bacterium]
MLPKIIYLRILWLLLMTSAATMWIGYVTRYGLALSPDSVAYMATAEHILDGTGLIQHDTEAFVRWTPLYPLTLALTMKITGLPVLSAMRLFNLIFFVGICMTVGLWFIRHIHQHWLYAIGIVLVTLSYPLFIYSLWGLSELLFILLSLWCFIALERYMLTGRIQLIIIAGLLAILTLLSRYAGFFVIGTGGLLLLLNWPQTWIRRILDAALFGACTVPGGLAWTWHVKISTGASAPATAPPGTTMWDNFMLHSGFIVDWFWPQLSLKIFPGLAIVAVLVAILFYGFMLYRRSSNYKGRDLIPVWPHFFYFWAYSAALIITTSTLGITSMATGRISAPVFFPLIMTMIALLDIVLKSYSFRWRRIVMLIFLFAVMLSLRYTVIRFESVNRRFSIDGPDELHQFALRDSELWTYLIETDNDTSIWYSDNPYLVYLYTRRPTKEIPHVTWRLQTWMDDVLPTYLEDGMQVRIIWTSSYDTFYAVDESIIQGLPNMIPEATFDNARIFLIR